MKHHASYYRTYTGDWTERCFGHMTRFMFFYPSLDPDKNFYCDMCHHYYLKSEMVRISDAPFQWQGFYCPCCADKRQADIYKSCKLCGDTYKLRTVNDKRYCDKCYPHTSAKSKVSGANSVARKHGEPATLTVDQWIETLNYFDNKCAYCGGPFDLIEHFISIGKGVGTTKGNCVPACNSCNIRKLHSERYMKNFETVRLYLWGRQLECT